jgi:TolA-binding protein
MIGAHRRMTFCAGALLALAAGSVTVPAAAQDGGEARLRKLEAEVRALQRKVFPGSSGRFFEAEIQPGAAEPNALPPTSSPVNDLVARVDAMEQQLQRLTALIEEGGNRVGKLEGRVRALETTAVPVDSLPVANPGLPPPGGLSSSTPSTRPVRTPPAGQPGPVATAERLAAVQSIVKPASGDAGEDEYLYGYRLWEARFYPEAAQQLQATVKKYPRHPRVSYSRNLLGRAYLDDGKPGTAAQVFLENYQSDRKGARAPDSLLYLAVAMGRLKENQRACVALQELEEAYPQEIAGRLAPDYRAARAAVKCS